MSQTVFNKVYVETQIKPGTISISFENTSNYWIIDNNFQQLTTIIQKHIKHVIEEKSIVAAIMLRLVIVTSDLASVADYWGRQLGSKNTKTTQNELGIVAGKTMVWGNGEPESTYAVIILREDVAAAFLADGLVFQDKAKHVLIHELAHIQTEFIHLDLYGSDSPELWTYLHRAFAHRIWGEYYSEVVACTSVKECPNCNTSEMCLELLQQTIMRIDNYILAYRDHTNTDRLLTEVDNQLSTISAQIGRCLGQIDASADKDARRDQFLNDIALISSEWKNVTLKASEQLRKGIYTPDAYDELGEIAVEYFHCSGLFPRMLPDGVLWIDVPYER